MICDTSYYTAGLVSELYDLTLQHVDTIFFNVLIVRKLPIYGQQIDP